MTGPYFETWSHENLAKFAKEAYVRLQEQEQLRAAVAAEREACAKLCDDELERWDWDASVANVAIAIRARGEKT